MHHRALGPTLCLVLLVLALPTLAGGIDADRIDRDGLAPLSFGFKGGIGVAQHQGTTPRDMEYSVSSSLRGDFAAGVFLTLPVTRRFAIQQEVLYVRKGSRQEIGVDIFEVPTVLDVVYDMDYIEIPVMTRYHWLVGRKVDVYSLAGFAFALKINDRYRLSGLADDGVETVPLSADADMSEVDIFDFVFTYGMGVEIPTGRGRLLVEYRFDLSLEALPLPTYANVPFGDEQTVVENEPVPLRNQCHLLLVGLRF